MLDENEPRCGCCGQVADDLIHCLDCKLSLCRRCARIPCVMLEEAPDLRGLAERDQKMHNTPDEWAAIILDNMDIYDTREETLGFIAEQVGFAVNEGNKPTPAGAVTDLRATLDAQLRSWGSCSTQRSSPVLR